MADAPEIQPVAPLEIQSPDARQKVSNVPVMHADWSPEATGMTSEQRAEVIRAALEDVDRQLSDTVAVPRQQIIDSRIETTKALDAAGDGLRLLDTLKSSGKSLSPSDLDRIRAHLDTIFHATDLAALILSSYEDDPSPVATTA